MAVLEKEIAELQLNISKTEKDISRSKFVEQGAVPKSVKAPVQYTSSPQVKYVDSSAPILQCPAFVDSSVPVVTKDSTLPEGSTVSKKDKVSSSKEKLKEKKAKKKTKGEVNLDVLRQDKVLNKLVEKQLMELAKSGTISYSKPSTMTKAHFSESSESDKSDSASDSSAKHKVKKSSKSCLPSDTDSSDSSESSEKKKKHKKKRKSGMVKKSSDHVKSPQTWPHSALQYEYVSKSVKYEDLDFRLFVAGELEIISSDKIKPTEKDSRIAFLKKIVYYSSIYQWKALLDFYAAFVRQVELGKKKWGDDTVGLEVPLLSKNVKPDIKKSTPGFKKDISKPFTWYCAAFQKNKCTKQSPHSTVIRGVSREVHHFCAACYRIDKIKNVHPESSSACPHFTE